MLKITTHPERQPATLILEGALAGLWVAEAQRAWYCIVKQAKGRPIVDLTGVVHISREGKLLLKTLCQEGAELRARGCFTRSLIQEMSNEQAEIARGG